MRRKGKIEDDIYEDDDYYDDEYYEDEDDYYGEEEEYEDKKQSKKSSKKNKENKENKENKNKEKTNNQTNNKNKEKSNINNKDTQKEVNKNTNKSKQANNIVNDLNLEAKNSVSSIKSSSTNSNQNNINNSNSVSSSNISMTSSSLVKDLNKIQYPKIEYKSKISNDEDMQNLNIVIIGHVDSGKSTMIGHLLCLLKEINTKDLKKQMVKKKGAEMIDFSWAADESKDERERGVTIDIAFKNFKTKTKYVTAMDAPGHRDFIPNMIAGTSAADAALLIIDSGPQAFDAGFFRTGQTREHALLAKSLGVNQIIVAVNKLELLNWNMKRFLEIKTEIGGFLKSLGFEEKNIFFIPISGLTGDNLIEKIKSDSAKWYEGPTLIELIDSLETPQRDINAPVRFIITDISQTTVGGLQGKALYGKLESGIIENNVEYLIMPLGMKYKVRSLAVNHKKVEYVLPGQQAEVMLNIPKGSKEEIDQGNILCSIKYPIPYIGEFKAQIKTVEITIPLSLGQNMMLYIQGQKTQVKIKKIEKIYNEESTQVKKNPRFIPKNFYADVILLCENKICAELYLNIKKLSVITLRINGETQAMGFIQEFIN